MARLYFRIYLAVLGSIVLFALLVAIAWRLRPDDERFGPRPELLTAVAEQIAPPANLPMLEQLRRLETWRDRSGYELAVFARDGSLIVATDDIDMRRVPRPSDPRPPWVHVAELPDGRVLVALRPPPERPMRRFGWLLALFGIGIAVAIAAYPLVRRLTRRLETLQDSVAKLGSGDLSARVKVEGKDEVGRLAQTFNAAADRIQTLVLANRSLLANASHELRSPLARLRMAIETLPPGASEATRAEIARNIRELDGLIEEILLASRLDAVGAASSEAEEIDLVGLVAEECAATDARLTFADGAPPLVMGDPRLLRRLVRNLLNNAERYGGGVPEVTVGRDGANATLVVADRGPGVPEGERERIFEPFYRAAGAREREGGVGLGLALVREIARKHGGDVVCQPRSGGGSQFKATFPIKV